MRSSDGRVIERVAGLGSPLSIAVDNSGKRYIGDGKAGRVTVYDAAWRQLFKLSHGDKPFQVPGDIVIDPTSGRIYVAESGADSVRVFDAAGQFLFDIGGSGSDDGLFSFPSGLAIDRVAGELLVSDQTNSRIQVFDLDGNFRFCIGRRRSFGLTTFSVPQGLSVDAQGFLYVTDPFDGRIQVLERLGEPGANGEPLGFALLGIIGMFGSRPGELRIPSDIVIDPSNRLFVAASNNSRLEVYGIGSYDDPERYVPAVIDIEPDPLPSGCSETPVVINIEVPGYRLNHLAVDSIAVNGVSAHLAGISMGDRDRDAIPDLRVEFEGSALLETLPEVGSGTLIVTGQIGDKIIEESIGVTVVASGDRDNDGVCDLNDGCPDTSPGDLVDFNGCSIGQLCPCNASKIRPPRERFGGHMRCVRQVARDWLNSDLLLKVSRRDITNAAKKARCLPAAKKLHSRSNMPH